jgi:hypothetical protein
MFARRIPFKRQDSVAGSETVAKPASTHSDEKNAATDRYPEDQKLGFEVSTAPVSQDAHLNPADESVDDLDPRNRLANGKERPIETAEDIATRCISLEDDPEMIIHTVRMWTLGLGLTCFAAVLGQIFYFRPQTVYVSQLFLQIIAFVLGKLWHTVLPNADKGRVWRLLNPCDFTLKEHVAIREQMLPVLVQDIWLIVVDRQ